MPTFTSICSVFALTFALGCASGDADDGGGSTDAAPPTVDAAPSIDAGPTGSNLGATCMAGTTPCVGQANACLSIAQNGPGFCSFQCATALPLTTNDQGQVPVPTDNALHTACAANYTGIGVPLCAVIVGGNVPNPPLANTEYLVDLACGVACEMTTMACPTGLSCSGGLCVP